MLSNQKLSGINGSRYEAITNTRHENEPNKGPNSISNNFLTHFFNRPAVGPVQWAVAKKSASIDSRGPDIGDSVR